MRLAELGRRWDAAVLDRRDLLDARLRRRHPRFHGVLFAVLLSPVVLVESLVPPRRVRPLTAVLAVATVLDSLFTWLWLAPLGVATEANPLVAGLLEATGVGVGLVLRTVVSLGLLAAAHALARRRWEGRHLLVLLAVPLLGVVVLHLGAGAWLLLR